MVLALLAGLVFSAAAIGAAGDPDPTFSGDGKTRTDFGAGSSTANAAVRQADGKIVAVGQADDNFLVARYNLDGSLDPSFSGDGRTQTNFTVSDGATDVVLRGNKIVVVGFTNIHGSHTNDFALARYNPDGSLDTNFSGDGRQTSDFGGSDTAQGVAIQDGKIVAVGGTALGFALTRYNLNGTLDTSFSGDGRQVTEFGSFGSAATDVAIQGVAKLVVVGLAFGPHGHSDFVLGRYNRNGTLDTSFSGDGRQMTQFGFSGKAGGVAIQGNGKIVAVGTNLDTVDATVAEFALARYNSNGSLDTSFSGDGRQTTAFPSVAAAATEVAIQGNGRIVAVGSAGADSNSQDFALARYNGDGTLDSSFSDDGRKRTSFGGSDRANGVALQGDGRIVAVGEGNGEFALARYLGG